MRIVDGPARVTGTATVAEYGAAAVADQREQARGLTALVGRRRHPPSVPAAVAVAPWRPAPAANRAAPAQRLAAGDRRPAPLDLVAHRLVLAEVPLLERRQPVVAQAQLGQGGQLAGQLDRHRQARRRTGRRG